MSEVIMPKVETVTGTVPPSKSQRNKGKKRKPSSPMGGVCSACEQVCASATQNTPHTACPGITATFYEKTRTEALPSGLKDRLVAKPGIWLSKGAFEDMAIMRDRKERRELDEQEQIDLALATLEFDRKTAQRHYDAETKSFKNGFGEPIDFGTGEVLITGGNDLVTVELTSAEEAILSGELARVESHLDTYDCGKEGASVQIGDFTISYPDPDNLFAGMPSANMTDALVIIEAAAVAE